jgi:glycerophosphoryl diester phosphodiesterase
VKLVICLVSFFFVPLHSMVIVAHRGASGYAPENTLSAFARAIESKVDAIEFDVRKCSTGELVIFHDAKVGRITDGYGYVASKSLDELKKLKVLEVESIPTLKEALDFIDRRAKVYIELKDLNIIDDVLQVVDYYVDQKQWVYSDFLIASFDHTQLQKSKAARSNLATAALVYGMPVSLGLCASEIDADIICLDSEFTTQQFVDDIHARGMLVYVYTVNDGQELMRLSSYNIDGIITDFLF